MIGAAVSLIVMVNWLSALAPLVSVTRNVSTWVPSPRWTWAVAPVAIDRTPSSHSYVNGSRSGSDEPEPSRLTSAPPATHARVRSAPATATGAWFDIVEYDSALLPGI